MTKYKLEEFKEWLEADPARKARLPYGRDTLDYLSRYGFKEYLRRNNMLDYTTAELVGEWMDKIDQEEETRVRKILEELNQINNLILPNQPYNFQFLQAEIQRLRIQDLTIQIPLKKQELEQSTNNLKNNLGSAGKYLLEKLIKKQNKLLQNNEANSNKLAEIKQALKEELNNNQERLQELLNKQKELFGLEKHLANLQNE